jgi:hypothetical protein
MMNHLVLPRVSCFIWLVTSARLKAPNGVQ